MPSTPNLKKIREGKFLSQQELADASGIHKVTIARLESGKATARGSSVRKLAEALGVKPEKLVGD